jgi:DNA processing protein
VLDTEPTQSQLAPCSSTELAHWIHLAETRGVGSATGRALLRKFGAPQQLFAAGYDALRAAQVPDLLARALCAPMPTALARLIEHTCDWLQGSGHAVVPFGSPHYPPLLAEIADPPLLLYCSGQLPLLAAPALAVVGSRNASAQGKANAHALSKALSGAGLTIVSGMALGIDGAAHAGALEGAGSTIAVVGSGVDQVYPQRHQGLAQQLAAHGCIVSEYALGTPPMAANFPRRNRIISGLARGVLVVEAAARSGSLITARLAGDQGRDVFAVPGSIHSALAKGCHALIRDGATLVECADDVLQVLRMGALAPAASSPPPELGVLAALGHDPVPLDTLAARLGWSAGRLGACLLDLELDGLVELRPGGAVQRVARDAPQ